MCTVACIQARWLLLNDSLGFLFGAVNLGPKPEFPCQSQPVEAINFFTHLDESASFDVDRYSSSSPALSSSLVAQDVLVVS